MKVITTDASLNLNIKIAELGRVARPGEVFEITDDRLKTLTGANRFGAVFVRPIEKIEPQERFRNFDSADQAPEIYIVNPGEEPVRVDEDLNPIVKEENTVEEKPKKKKKKANESSEG